MHLGVNFILISIKADNNLNQLHYKSKMMKTISISGLAVATVVFISGCGATPHYPQTTIFGNGVTYHPTWNGYNECMPYNDRASAECYVKNSDGTHDSIVAVLQPDIDATMNSFLKTYTTIDNLCKYVNNIKLLPDSSYANSCQNNVRERLLKANNYEKAYNWGLIDQKTWLIHNRDILKAYQAGLIDKDTAKTEMLKHGQIIEAYQAKLIDKDTADLYLQKQAMDNATRASQQQVRAAQDQADAIRRAGIDAQFANSPNMLNQQLQNIQNNNQMNQMINQQNINNNMRKYY